jgi:hypothetical protein
MEGNGQEGKGKERKRKEELDAKALKVIGSLCPISVEGVITMAKKLIAQTVFLVAALFLMMRFLENWWDRKRA